MWFGAAAGELDSALVTAVWAFLGIVVTTLGTIAAQALRSRKDSSPVSTSTSSVDSPSVLMGIAKDIGQLDQRAEDNDVRDDWQDRRLEALERYNEHRDPEWRDR